MTTIFTSFVPIMHNTFPTFNPIMHHSCSTEALPSITSWQPSCLLVLSVTQEALNVSISHSTQNRHILTLLFTPFIQIFIQNFLPSPPWYAGVFGDQNLINQQGESISGQDANTRNPSTKNSLLQSQKSCIGVLSVALWPDTGWNTHFDTSHSSILNVL